MLFLTYLEISAPGHCPASALPVMLTLTCKADAAEQRLCLGKVQFDKILS